MKRRQAKRYPYLVAMSIELRDMQRRADEFSLGELSEDDWFDFAHQHPDFRCLGNRSAYARSLTIRLGKQYLDTIVRELSGWTKPSVCWCMVDAAGDSGDDSVHYHSANPNPNGGPFPYSLTHVRWGAPAPTYISKVFPAPAYLIGADGQNPIPSYWIIANTLHDRVNAGVVEDARRAAGL